MAKLTLTDIASGYKAKETLNENNAAIEDRKSTRLNSSHT